MAQKRFLGKSVWVTGASSGIGRSVALEFARQGARVAVSGRRQERLREVAREIEDLGQQSLAVPCDVTDEGAVKDAVARTVEAFGNLDVAVANAGFGVNGLFEKLTVNDWRRQMEVNVIGAASTALHALPALKETGGRLALIASVAGMICLPTTSAYSASKFALRAMGLTLAQELHGSGVSCTTIHPGFVESEIARVDNEGNFHPDRKDKRPQKLMWTSERAARVIVRAIYARKREYVFSLHGRLGAFLGKHAPGLVHFVLSRTSKR